MASTSGSRRSTRGIRASSFTAAAWPGRPDRKEMVVQRRSTILRVRFDSGGTAPATASSAILEGVAGDAEGAGQIGPHADPLGTLAGKDKSSDHSGADPMAVERHRGKWREMSSPSVGRQA